MEIRSDYTRIASWGIFDRHGRRLINLPYNCKEQAEQILVEINSKNKGQHFLQIVKQPLGGLPNKILSVVPSTRKVHGFGEDKDTGDSFMWSKTFKDLFIVSSVLDYMLETEVTIHKHKGKLCVVGYKSVQDFEQYCKYRWPEDWPIVMVHVD